MGTTRVNHLRGGQVTTFEITPEDFGLKRCTLEQIRTGTPQENAATITGVFSGGVRPRRTPSCSTPRARWWLAAKPRVSPRGIALAQELIDSGAAPAKLESSSGSAPALLEAAS